MPKWKLASWGFLATPPYPAHFYLHLPLPFPLWSLSCSVLVTFPSVFSCVALSWKGGLAGRFGGLRGVVQLARLQLSSHRFSCSPQIRPARFPETTCWVSCVLLPTGLPHSFPLHSPSQVPMTLGCWAVGTIALSTCFMGTCSREKLSPSFVTHGHVFWFSIFMLCLFYVKNLEDPKLFLWHHSHPPRIPLLMGFMEAFIRVPCDVVQVRLGSPSFSPEAERHPRVRITLCIFLKAHHWAGLNGNDGPDLPQSDHCFCGK